MSTKEEWEQLSQDELDSAVHDAKSEEAARINNEGREAQIEYLMDTSRGTPERESNTTRTFGALRVQNLYPDSDVVFIYVGQQEVEIARGIDGDININVDGQLSFRLGEGFDGETGG